MKKTSTTWLQRRTRITVIGALCMWLVACGGASKSAAPRANTSSAPAPKASAPKPADVPEHIPVRGPRDAPVTIVAFASFQCVYCAKAHATLVKLRERYGANIRIAYVHKPLNFQRRSRPAAIASMAAQRQGKFWDMHDAFYERFGKLSERDILDTAQALGLDMARFATDRKDPAIAQEVSRQALIGDVLGARGTPTFFVNGIRVGGAQPIDRFSAIVERAMQVHEQVSQQGLSGRELLVESWRRADPRNGPAVVKYLVDGDKITLAALVTRRGGPAQPTKWMQGQRWQAPIDTSDDPWRGGAKAKVTLVLFTDLQCPFCRRLEGTLAKVRQSYPDTVRIVFKHLPLSFHKQALPAHMMLLAAKAQGKFWDLHDAFLQVPTRKMTDTALRDAATGAGVDLAKLDQALAAPGVRQRVRKDQDLARSLGVFGTPTMFINGYRLGGAYPYKRVKEVIDRAMHEAGDLTGDDAYQAATKDGRTASPLGVAAGIDKGAGLTLHRGEPRVLTVAIDLENPRSRGSLRNAWHIATTRQDIGVQLLPTVGKRPFSRDVARLLLLAADKGQETLRELVARMLRTGAIAARYQLTRMAKDVGLDLATADAQAASLDNRLDAIDKQVKQSGLPGTPAIVLDGRLLQPPRGYHVKSLSAALRMKL